ncbi:Uncharacterised protein [Salmonella enterica subsp. enterica serovar Typhimurium str. DT104]|nr:Uncharacterised protein [Salmonella enterica subsp. enterica serovar Typhimurium str. DT104]CQB08797.1 Uncharacterised protein [Salmonella enterica subsp. enterica serovar Typhimurium str. DT104]CQE91792.1 Uncharacterised protein [Salmonella enterica subsp. enterica serovar Typhimurium str. DT104]CQF04269.1 Uncharacterised protein [Salmonella enterica subsp. enterica serovar Typhimurium str. DT104]CQG27658.1 Uncharacterised protein [Salmonella enterica subsp. enterica serovar Typhimurium str
MARQHVDFIDQIDFKATARRRVLDVIQQVAGVFDFGTRCGVNLNEIDKTPLLNFPTVIANAARRRGNTGFAVQPLRQQPGDRGFTDAARAGKKICVMNAP